MFFFCCPVLSRAHCPLTDSSFLAGYMLSPSLLLDINSSHAPRTQLSFIRECILLRSRCRIALRILAVLRMFLPEITRNVIQMEMYFIKLWCFVLCQTDISKHFCFLSLSAVPRCFSSSINYKMFFLQCHASVLGLTVTIR